MIPQLNHNDLLPPKPIISDFLGSDEEKKAYQAAILEMQYLNPQSFRDQVKILTNHLHNDELRVSYDRIAKLFGVSKQCICNQHVMAIEDMERALPHLDDPDMVELSNRAIGKLRGMTDEEFEELELAEAD